METTIKATKLFVQEIENLPANPNSNNGYIVDRSDDSNCIYKILEIPSDYHMIVNITKRGVFSVFNNSEKSRGTIMHVTQFNQNQHYYKSMEHVQLLVKYAAVEEIKIQDKNRYYSNDGLLSIIVDDKLKITSPHSYQKPHYPIQLLKENGVYQIKCFSVRFDLMKTVAMYLQDPRDTGISDVDNKIYKMINAWNLVKNTFHFEMDRETTNEILQLFSGLKELPISNTEGIVKTYNLVKTFYENLILKDFLSALAFKSVADSCKNTVNGIKYSTVFNKLFSNIASEEEFIKKTFDISELYLKNLPSMSYNKNTFLIEVLDTLSEAREMKKAVLKRKSTGAFNKIMDDLEFIQIDQTKYPTTYAAVMAGEIPTSTFFRKSGESYFMYNDNWEIWEEILQEHKEVAIQIATEASRRTTYEKDIMSYFYFVLHALPEYLEKNTGKKWKGIPKLVNSANELDPPTEGSTGTAKTRSALTPIVDNEKSEVVVPYVSMQISGYQTTYCYGLNYSVLQRGFSFLGNTVTADVEKNLNGRDNYGLMFYTLTGTAQGRGYPTFLIIFENMDKEKYGQNYRVHFHRTHPMRSKGGDYNPIHNWTKGCYKWMIGNVNYERIIAQQGDLAFVQIDAFPEGEHTLVDSYDSHCFSSPVKFTPYVKKEKQNILGYVEIIDTVTLNHTEHLNREIPKGVYEIRQCRSWEANPKGIWSLRID